ncbi:MAG: cytochrome c biogenesis protein CcsA [Armatimonadetes bacterium]|nr:cytochrome c biogenesis protein CcsA [Armatimonadota bacterium]
MEGISSITAIISYGLGFALYLTELLKGKGRSSLFAHMLTGIAAFFHVFFLIFWGLRVKACPLISPVEAIPFVGLVVIATYFYLLARHRMSGLGPHATFLAFLSLFLSMILPKAAPSVPGLASHWLVFHIAVIFLSYGLLAVAFSTATLYIVQEKLLKAKKLGGVFRKLPPLEELDSVVYRLILLSFPLLTLGLLTGAVWARQEWGSFWTWDPKQTWSLATWVLYTVYLHSRVVMGWRGRKTIFLVLIAFGALVFTFLGVNLMKAGSHQFG